MACGCADTTCSCIVEGANGNVVTGAGTIADPYVVTGGTFAATEGDGIEITPGGTAGHEPEIAVKVDPASTAPVSVGPDGLLVDCCVLTAELETVDSTPYDPAAPAGTTLTLLVDNTAIPITIRLPAAPAAGQRIEVKDYGNTGAGNAATNNITINGSVFGNDIDGAAADYVILDDGDSATFVFDGTGGYAVI